MRARPYYRSQVALADLKMAALDVLGGDMEGVGTSADNVVRLLGLSVAHLDNKGQLVDVILGILEHEGLATRNSESGLWFPVAG